MPLEETLKELGLFNLLNRRPKGTQQHAPGTYEEAVEDTKPDFRLVHGGNRNKLK